MNSLFTVYSKALECETTYSGPHCLREINGQTGSTGLPARYSVDR
jgi:hypothetical protein